MYIVYAVGAGFLALGCAYGYWKFGVWFSDVCAECDRIERESEEG